jgi:hypothetical protein
MQLAANDDMDFSDALLVMVYLVVGTMGIALLMGWVLKHFK